MTTQAAIKKLEKNGFTVTSSRSHFLASHPDARSVIEFFRNGGSDEVVCISVRQRDEKNDVMTDYFAGTYTNTITSAIRLVGAHAPSVIA
jgi:hypothetical protein